MPSTGSSQPQKKKKSPPAACIALIKEYLAQVRRTKLIEERRILIQSTAALIDFLTEMKMGLNAATAGEVAEVIAEVAQYLIALDKYHVLPKPFPALDIEQIPGAPQCSAFSLCLSRIDTLLHRLNMKEADIAETFTRIAPLLEWLTLVRLEPTETMRAGFYLVMTIDTLVEVEQKSAVQASPLLLEKRQLLYSRRDQLRRLAIEP